VRRYILVILATVIVLGGAVAFGLFPRLTQQKALLAASKEETERLPVVNVAEVRRSPANAYLTLPGTIVPILEAPIYARADGYLRKLYVDIGDHVKAGQVLADIESPEMDQELRQGRATENQSKAALKQAEAQLEQAKANREIAKLTLDRWKQLVARGVVSKQETDEKQAIFNAREADVNAAIAAVGVAQSNLASNEANVQRLTEMKAFDHVTAPFDGIITVRNTTTGTLISAGTESPNHELYREAQMDRLRIWISVPQAHTATIHDGMPADLTVQNLPGRVFHGSVNRTANSLDEASRTMRAEVRVENPDHALLPGMYAEVKFATKRATPPLTIPGDAVVTRANGTQVALVDDEHKVHVQKVLVGTDTGAEVEVLSGLSEGQFIIINPTDEVREGVRVNPRKAAAKAK
jgi:RND family efflux transporter MFP subunit